MRASRGLKWENKMYKLKRSIQAQFDSVTFLTISMPKINKISQMDIFGCIIFFLAYFSSLFNALSYSNFSAYIGDKSC